MTVIPKKKVMRAVSKLIDSINHPQPVKVKLSRPAIKLPIRVLPPDPTLVQPDPSVEKSGCNFCPLFVFSHDFEKYRLGYQRNADAILAKMKEPHTVQSRNVSEKWESVDILYCGEAPGQMEDRESVPFVGKSGQLLRLSIDAVTTDQSSVKWGVANVVSCRPPLNRTPGKTEIQACGVELARQIAARNPKVIVPLGNVPLNYFTGREGIMSVWGKVLKCTRPGMEHIKIVPCVHPSYILRTQNPVDEQKFQETIAFAVQVLKGDYEQLQGAGEYFVVDRVDLVCELMQSFREDGRLCAFDTETGALSPHMEKFPKLLCLSFSNEEGVGYTVPLDHYESPWTLWEPKLEHIPSEVLPDRPRRGTKVFKEWEESNQIERLRVYRQRLNKWKSGLTQAKKERRQVIDALRGFFSDASVPKTGQNEKFDRSAIRGTLGVNVAGVVLDTMATHLVIDERRGTHGLDNLADSYTGMGNYHKPLDEYIKQHAEADPDRGGSYANIPGKILFPYASADSDVTLRVLNKLQQEPEYVKHLPLQNLAEKFLPRLSRTLADLEYNGAQIDMKIIKEMEVDLKGKMERSMSAMSKLPQVRRYVAGKLADAKKKAGEKTPKPFTFNPGSPSQVGVVLFEQYGCRPTQLTDGGFDVLKARYERLKKDDSGLDFSKVIDGAIEKREWSFFSTSADVLNDYDRQGVDFTPLLIKYREAQTLYGTFVEPIERQLDPEGRIHGSFLTTGTGTGRLCVAGDTVLETSFGNTRIDQLTLPDDRSLTIETHLGRHRRIINKFYKGEEPMIQVVSTAGSIVCTKGHRILVDGVGWVHAGDLKVGNEVASPNGPAVVILIRDYSSSCGVWDIEVEEDHSYVAHGYYNHNSSAGPNLQNIPAYAQNAYISRFNVGLDFNVLGADSIRGLLLFEDLNQIELRVACCLWGDEPMMKVYREGGDIHRKTALAISGLTEAQYDALGSGMKKEWRVRAKRVSFGIIYGISAIGLVNILRKDSVFITKEEAQEMLDKFFAAHPQLVRGIAALHAEIKRTGRCHTFTGRFRRLPEVFSTSQEIVSRALRQGGNAPVQGGAGDITLMGMTLIHEWMVEEQLKSKMILTVHDSLGIDSTVDETIDIAVKMDYVMSNIHKLSHELLPTADWSWRKVPIVAEFDCGLTWGKTVKFKPSVVADGTTKPPKEKLWYIDDKKEFQCRYPVNRDELLELVIQRYRAAA